MNDDRDRRSRVTISHDSAPAETLVVGFSEFGLAGLTAVEYLVDHYDMTESGHLSVESLPAITPFENGVPRHHTRLFGGGPDLTVLVGELFIPVEAADDVASSLLSWADDNGIEEVVVLSGCPSPTARTTTSRTTSPPRTSGRRTSRTPTCARWGTASSKGSTPN